MSVSAHLSHLANAHAELGQFDDAWCCAGEAIAAVETTRERWYEAEINRIAGEIALMSPKPDETKAQTYFEHALAIARRQQAKSWELRASMSLARLWRDQGKVSKRANCLLRFTGGSLRDLTRAILKRRRRFWRNWRRNALLDQSEEATSGVPGVIFTRSILKRAWHRSFGKNYLGVLRASSIGAGGGSIGTCGWHIAL